MKKSGLVSGWAFFLLLLVLSAANIGAAEILQGDLDGSGIIDAADQVILSNYLAGNLDSIFAQFGQFYDYDSIVQILRLVPGGTFPQGSPLDEPCRWVEETQFTHTLTRNLAVMATEVTRQMWADLKAAQPTLPADPTSTDYGAGMTNPVQYVTWYEAVLFANLLSVQRGLTRAYYTDAGFTNPITASNYTTGPFYCDFDADGYRIPTEGEWEYCCRAGTATPFWIAEPNYAVANCGITSTSGMYPALETAAWFWGNSSSIYATSPAGTKAPNPWGLHDTHGNVWEWCWDWYGTYPSGSATNYAGPETGSTRVVRGGGWFGDANYCRSAFRYSFASGYRNFNLGFRLARSLP